LNVNLLHMPAMMGVAHQVTAAEVPFFITGGVGGIWISANHSHSLGADLRFWVPLILRFCGQIPLEHLLADLLLLLHYLWH
jgi:hypothetical protein